MSLATLKYVPLTTESRRIHDSTKIAIPWHTNCGDNTRRVPFTWNPDRTVLKSVKLRARVHSNLGSVFFKYLLNDQEILGFHWAAWEGGQWREGEADVAAYLVNGDNYFKALACKDFWYPLTPEVTVVGDLVIEFEGEPPEVKPPTEPGPWYEIPLYIGLGVAGVAAVGYLIHALKGRD